MASTSTMGYQADSKKRKLSTSSDDDHAMIKHYFTLEKEDECNEDTGSESIYTVQGRSTIIVDDPTDSEWSDSDVEYDVRSLPSNPDHPFMFDRDNSSTSEESEAENQKLELPVIAETEDSEEADNSSDSGTVPPFSDPEISPADFWKCAQCSAKNNNPMFRYCEKCFKVRKEFFPARPRGHKKRNPQLIPNSQTSHKFSDSESSGTEEIKDPNAPAKSFPASSSQSTVSTDYSRSISTDSGLSDVADSHLEDYRTCNICFKNPKNAGFFHGGKVHVYCCYKCAKKVWLYFKKCPVCNRKVSCVVRLIFS